MLSSDILNSHKTSASLSTVEYVKYIYTHFISGNILFEVLFFSWLKQMSYISYSIDQGTYKQHHTKMDIETKLSEWNRLVAH